MRPAVLVVLLVAAAALAGVLSSGCSTTSRTPTSSRTPSNTPTITQTPSRTRTFTTTETYSRTETASRTVSGTFTISFTRTNSGTTTATRTSTETFTITETPSVTPTFAPTIAAIVAFGGSNQAGLISYNDVLLAGIVSGGGLNPWVPQTPMPTPITTTRWMTSGMWAIEDGQGSVVYGHPGEPNGTQFTFGARLFSAPASSSSVGPWTEGTPPALPGGGQVLVNWGGGATDGSFVYVVGNSATTDVYVGTLAGGTVSAWTTAANPLPAQRDNIALVQAQGYLFAICGRDTVGGGNPVSTIFTAPLTSPGIVGAWTTQSFPIPLRRANRQAAVANDGTDDYLYVAGGFDGTSTLSTVYYAQIQSGGVLGSWQTTTALPMVTSYSELVAAGGALYLIGGYDPGTGAGYSDVYWAPVQGGGTLGSWTSTFALPTERRMVAAVAIP